MADLVIPALTGFLGGLVSLVVHRRLGKELDQAEMSCDLVVQLASELSGLEGHLEALSGPPITALTHKLLKDLPSGFDLSPSALSLSKLLETFSNPEIHRLLVLYYNRLDLYEKRSAEHREAYYWLLDSPLDADWTTPAAADRISTVEVCRANMLEYARDLLQYGSELVHRVLMQSDSFFVTFVRGNLKPYRDFLEQTYGLTRDSARLRRAYYASRPSVRFSPQADEVLVVWDDALAHRLGGAKARLSATVNGELGQRCIPAFVEVALPRRVRLTDLAVLPAAGSKWVTLDGPPIERDFAGVGCATLALPSDHLAKFDA
jgi:hypothetical protein